MFGSTVNEDRDKRKPSNISRTNHKKSRKMIKEFNLEQTDRIIEMAWEDRTPFEAIEFQFGISESEVIELMRSELKESSFKLWRKRVNSGVSQKHLKREAKKSTVLNAADKE